LPDAIAHIARRNIDLLVVNGGDGSLQYVLTEILHGEPFERVPLIAPLRGGRTNMTALDLGAHRNPIKGLTGLLASIETGTLSERFVDRPVLRVESASTRSVSYGMFVGVGMIRRAIELTHRVFPTRRSQGSFGAGLVTASLVARLAFEPREGVMSPDKVRIMLDGEAVRDGEFYLVIASSLQRLFWRMRPFWGTQPAPVRFTSVSTSARHKPRAAPGVLRGRPKQFVRHEPGYTSCNVESAELVLDSGYTVDGELFPARPDEIVTITGDRRVTFVRA